MAVEEQRRTRRPSVAVDARPSRRPSLPSRPSAPTSIQGLRNARLAYLSKAPEQHAKLAREDRLPSTQTIDATKRQSRRRPGLERQSGNPGYVAKVPDAKDEVDIGGATGVYVYGPPPEAAHPDAPAARYHGALQLTPLKKINSQASSTKQTSPVRNRHERRGGPSQTTQPLKLHDPDRRQQPTAASDVGSSEKLTRRATASGALPSRSPATSTAPSQTLSARGSSTAPSNRSSSASNSGTRRKSGGLLSLFTSKPAKPSTVECSICSSSRPTAQVATLTCCHTKWCHKCLEHMFRRAVATPALFEHPRCACRNSIDLAHVAPIFKHDVRFQRRWNALLDEHTLGPQGTYCANARCARWIHPRHTQHARPGTAEARARGGRGRARCPRCRTDACARCGRAWHGGRTCAAGEEAERAFAALAARQGWQRCPACARVVERDGGCNHMRCVPQCGAEFCYRCGALYDALHECPPELAGAEGAAEAADGGTGQLRVGEHRRPVNVFDFLQPEPLQLLGPGWTEPRASGTSRLQRAGAY